MPGICIDGPEDGGQQILLDIWTKRGKESFLIEPLFTGKLVLSFNQGGFAACEQVKTVKKVKKLK